MRGGAAVAVPLLLLLVYAVLQSAAFSKSAAEREAHGTKLLAAGSLDAALKEATEALVDAPREPKLLLLRANTLATMRRFEEAHEAYGVLLDVVRGLRNSEWRWEAQALTWLGVTARRLGRNKEAIRWLRKADYFHPSHETRHHLAVSLALDSDFVASARATARAMALGAADEDFQLISTVLSTLEHWPLLERLLSFCLTHACSLGSATYPAHEIHVEYGVALERLGRHKEAHAHYADAQRLAGFADAVRLRTLVTDHVQKCAQNRAVLLESGRLSLATLPAALEELTLLFEPTVRGGIDAWRVVQSRYLHGFMWPIPDAVADAVRADLRAQRASFAHDRDAKMMERVVGPFACLTIPLYTLDDCVFAARVRTHKLHDLLAQSKLAVGSDGDFADTHRYAPLADSDALHVGLYSADLRPHPMLSLVRALLAYASPQRVRFTVYWNSADPDTLRDIGALVNGATVEVVATELGRAVAHARSNKVQLWLDTTGDTGSGLPALAAARPAPVGVLWAGFPGSLADPTAVQYMVADRYSVPPGRVADTYAERIIYLPGSWLVSDTSQFSVPLDSDAAAGANWTRAHMRAAMGIPLHAVVYGNFGRLWKLDGVTFRSWCSIAQRVFGSHFVVMHFRTSDMDTESAADNLRAAWRAAELAPHRLHIVAPYRRGEHMLALRALVDVALDTVHYGGGITSFEALYAGLPLVHRAGGDKLMQRAGGSLLVAAGLARELVARDAAHYERIAVRLGVDAPYREALQERLADAVAGRGDAIVFRPQVGVAALVEGLREAYRRWRSGDAPQHIFVDDALPVTWTGDEELHETEQQQQLQQQQTPLELPLVPAVDVRQLRGWQTTPV